MPERNNPNGARDEYEAIMSHNHDVNFLSSAKPTSQHMSGYKQQ